MEQSENINELFTALCKAQSEIVGAKKDSQNPFFKSHYADLASVWDAVREPITKNGLCVVQTIETEQDKLFVQTTLGHISGQFVKSKIPVLPQKHDPQSLGSAISYARRYSLTALLSVPQIDDDGEEAMSRIHNQNQSDFKLAEAAICAARSLNELSKIQNRVKISKFTDAEKDALLERIGIVADEIKITNK